MISLPHKKEGPPALLHSREQAGFAMLFTVLLVSLILTIALSISDLTLKQTLLSSLAKDSQIAFYQADAGVECGMYQDITLGNFPLGKSPAQVPNQFYCGENSMTMDLSSSLNDYFVFKEDLAGTASPCFSIVFDKVTTPGSNKVQTRGYNRCSVSPRQVERALEVSY